MMTACPRHPTANASIRLWDGRDHCVACVETVCPGLAQFAKGRPCLEDTFVFDKAESRAAWARMSGLMCGVFALVLLGILPFDPGLALLFGAATGIVLAFTIPMAYLVEVRFPRTDSLPTVRVMDGVVSVFRPSLAGGRRPMSTFPLSEARWHLGRFTEDVSCRRVMPDRPAIILLAPRKWPGVAPPNEKTATGSTPEMIRFWQGFLTLAGVSEDKKSREAYQETFGIVILCLAMFVLGVSTLVSGKLSGRGHVPVEGPVAVYLGSLLVVVSLGLLIAASKRIRDLRRKQSRMSRVV